MKKMIVACFAFLFLFTIVAGCSSKSDATPSKDKGNTADAVDFDDVGGDIMTSTDETIDEDIDF